MCCCDVHCSCAQKLYICGQTRIYSKASIIDDRCLCAEGLVVKVGGFLGKHYPRHRSNMRTGTQNPSSLVTSRMVPALASANSPFDVIPSVQNLTGSASLYFHAFEQRAVSVENAYRSPGQLARLSASHSLISKSNSSEIRPTRTRGALASNLRIRKQDVFCFVSFLVFLRTINIEYTIYTRCKHFEVITCTQLIHR